VAVFGSIDDEGGGGLAVGESVSNDRSSMKLPAAIFDGVRGMRRTSSMS
jgi:hypothetical protein